MTIAKLYWANRSCAACGLTPRYLPICAQVAPVSRARSTAFLSALVAVVSIIRTAWM